MGDLPPGRWSWPENLRRCCEGALSADFCGSPPSFLIDKAHDDSLGIIPVFFAENIDPSHVDGIFSDLDFQRNIRLAENIQIIEGHMGIDRLSVQVSSVLPDGEGFQEAVLGSAVRPGGGSEPSPAGAEVPR